MKREDLFQAIGEIDEDLLDEKRIKMKQKNFFPAIMSVAACIAIVAGAVWIMPQKIPSDNFQTGSKMQMETMAETIMNYDAPAGTEIPLVVESPSELLTQDALETEDFTQIHYPMMPAFQHGKYQAVNEAGEIRYFWFDDGGGRFEDEKSGMGLGFTLEYLEVYNEDGSSDAIFHMGTMDDNTRVNIARDENGTLIVKWQDGAEEIFTYLGESNE